MHIENIHMHADAKYDCFTSYLKVDKQTVLHDRYINHVVCVCVCVCECVCERERERDYDKMRVDNPAGLICSFRVPGALVAKVPALLPTWPGFEREPTQPLGEHSQCQSQAWIKWES
ncbi:hypothetical protein PGIGA_G00184740 [Pangasianodon gigas]|uniref:Uncharacterized protein n=1 Tax=Pangasianodon gigas TaxID=30993 RepID=A0ACC5WAN9_PANGG|nr:hypothetical protein [Pangasianodon gigas]